MVNYQNAKIYRIVCNVTGKQYIGSTCKLLCQRLAGHRGSYKCFKNRKGHYITSFKVLENDDFDIILIENFPCDNKEELLKRERHFIDTIDCLNKVVPTRTYKEWYEGNGSVYYEKNKEPYKAKNKEYYKANIATLNEKHSCECGGKFTYQGKAQHCKTKVHQAYVQRLQHYEAILDMDAKRNKRKQERAKELEAVKNMLI